MRKYTGWQYLLIDAANQYGWDKAIFEERIEWAEHNLKDLEKLAGTAETKPLYIKAVMAIRKAQAGLPTGHLVGMDAVCSGVQLMSAMTGCVAGAEATGLVDPDVRADAYSKLTEVMNELLGTSLGISRGDAKRAFMTSFYGSKAVPVELFGEATPELAAFYQASNKIAPGAWELLEILLASWKPYALSHEWKLPDGFDAKVKVMVKQEVRIEVDELDHATFSYEFYENAGKKTGLSNVANLVHSVDAYLLRCIHRRCNYDANVVTTADYLIQKEIGNRSCGIEQQPDASSNKVAYYIEQYERSDMVDVVILPYLNQYTVRGLSTKHLQALAKVVTQMLEYKPFPVIAIHDDFKVHPNNVNHLRQTYINIMAEIAESNILSDLLSQLFDKPVKYQKLSNNLGELIRGSEYAIC